MPFDSQKCPSVNNKLYDLSGYQSFHRASGKSLGCSLMITSPSFPELGAFMLVCFYQIDISFLSKPPVTLVMAILPIPVGQHVFRTFSFLNRSFDLSELFFLDL